MATDILQAIEVQPLDEHNRTLVGYVHPTDWQNPEPADLYDLVVIGAGPAGLVTAAGAAGLGAKVALVERHLMGGDCLNVGCVPSKSLIRSARAVGEIRAAARLGVEVPAGVTADFPAVMRRLREIRAGISHHDSAERFRDEYGIDVFIGQGSFAGPDAVEVAGATLCFRKAAIATGNRPDRLPIPGLEEAGYLTNESVFSLTELPRRVAVIGGGPIGCELSQAFSRLGSEVHLLMRGPQILRREDPDAAAIVQDAFLRDGMSLHFGCQFTGIERNSEGKTIRFGTDVSEESVAVDEILVAAGRSPNVEGLDLEKAGVRYDAKSGVEVNDFLQTTNPRIYAAGDICFPHKFTHVADAMARIVIKNALFVPRFLPFGLGRARASRLVIPWCTYTDPEIAHIGMYEKDAPEMGLEIDTFVQELKDVDRAITDGETEGFVKVHVRKGTDKILGATIVAPHAGDMIGELSVAIAGGVGLGTIASAIHPYPTQSEAIRKVGDAYNRTKLTPFAKKVLAFVKGLS